MKQDISKCDQQATSLAIERFAHACASVFTHPRCQHLPICYDLAHMRQIGDLSAQACQNRECIMCSRLVSPCRSYGPDNCALSLPERNTCRCRQMQLGHQSYIAPNITTCESMLLEAGHRDCKVLGPAHPQQAKCETESQGERSTQARV